jgi:hypothetical protein
MMEMTKRKIDRRCCSREVFDAGFHKAFATHACPSVLADKRRATNDWYAGNTGYESAIMQINKIKKDADYNRTLDIPMPPRRGDDGGSILAKEPA